MAKLIAHVFSPQEHGYSTIEIDGLKETPKQFKKTPDTVETPPQTLCEHWYTMSKNQLGELRRGWSGTFTMYVLQEDVTHFKELVISSLKAKADHQEREYEATVAALEVAKNSIGKE